MAKLTKATDRIQAAIECGNCGRSIRASGNTFAEIQAKLAANTVTKDDARGDETVPAPIMVDDGNAKCSECHKGDEGGEEIGREDAEAIEDGEE